MFNKLGIKHYHIRWFSSKAKFKLDETMNEMIEKGEVKIKKHPGIAYPGIVNIPDKLLDIITTVLQDIPYKKLLKDAEILNRHLHGKHPPAEKQVYSTLYKKLQNFYINQYSDNMSWDKIDELKKRSHNKIIKYLKNKIHNSQTIDYDANKCLLYLLGRSMQDYSVMMKIFYEIKKRDPTFIPQSIFDFGSGTGTVIWAANETWNDKVQEYFGVDISEHMIDLSETILKKLKPKMKNIALKQYFPASLTPNYNMTVSAFTLMELPNTTERVNALYKLWSKTKNYMIVVENGTNSGFNLINEARDFILYASKQEKIISHVFSPCPHDLNCPKFATNSGKPCSFETIFNKLPIVESQAKSHMLFSYVVFKKAPREDEGWPRVIYPILQRSNHSWCNICTASGELHRTVFTKSKHGKCLYRCIKASDWGDRIPVQEVFEGTEDQDKTSSSSQAEEPSSESDLV